MNTPQRIAVLLNENKGQCFCDKCIEGRLSLVRIVDVHQVTQILKDSPAFVREAGLCSNCARERIVTKAAA